MKDALFCPYCYSSFTERQIMFRCTGRPSRTGKRCEPVADKQLQERTGRAGLLPPVFHGDGKAAKAVCQGCGGETTNRICPVCHSSLPVHFGKISSRMIALVGARQSGKTVFMTVLVHELMHRIGSRFNAATMGADDQTRTQFAGDYENPLYRDARLLGATTAARQTGREPLVFRFTTEERRRIGHSGPHHNLLSFFDTAGEDLISQASVQENVRYLDRGRRDRAAARPAADARRQEAGQAGHPAARGGTHRGRSGQCAGTGHRSGHDHRRRAEEKVRKPLAIAFSKLDALTHDLKETSPLRRPAPDTPFFDETDSQEVHTEILRLLTRWDGARIDAIAGKYYQRYRYFGLSALGETPTADNKVSPRGIRPYRVADPFLWAPGEFGAIR